MPKLDRTLLVIDDSPESSAAYEQQLRQDSTFSYRVLTERNDTQIFALCRSQQIDGILLELYSPRSRSLNFLGQLKKQMGEDCPPIVMIGSQDAEIAVWAFKHGAMDYLVKDQITPDDLRLTMGRAIENAELRQELQRRQKQFQTSVENMLDCFGIFSSIRDESGQIVDFRIDYLNAAACENNRMPKEMQIGRGLCEVLPGHRDIGLFDDYCRVVETGEPLIKDSLIYDDTYGGQRLIRAFDIRATKLNDGFVASWRDITDRKRMEVELKKTVAALQQQQNRLQRLIDTAPIGIGIGTASGEVSAINDAMLHLHGYTREEFEQQGMNWRDFALPEDAERTEQAIAQLRQQGFLPPEEKELLRRDGTRVPIWISATQWMDGSDEHVAFAVDLTPQKQAEAALNASQQRYRELAEAMPQIVWTADATGAVNYWNQRWYEYTGLSEAESMGLAGVSTVHPDERDRTLAQWSQSVANGEPFEIEYRIRRWDEVYHWFISRAIPTRDSHNQITGWIGTITNIDDIKCSEALVRRSEQLVRRVLDSLFSFVGVMTPDGVLIEANQTALAAASLQPTDVLGKPFEQTYWWSYSSEVQNQLRVAIERAAAGEVVRYDVQIRLGANRFIIIDFALVPLLGADGQVEYLIPSGIDITDRVQSQASLRESQTQLQQQLAEIEVIYQSAPIGLAFLNADLRFMRINQRLAEINGLPVEAHIGCTVRELLPDLADTAEPLLRSILETGEPLLNVEIHGETPAQPGVQRTWLEHFLPLKNGDRVIGISTVCEEITDRKLAEQEREQLLAQEKSARAEAERANRIKDEFLTVLSHELRSPLNPILGWTKLLQTRKFNETKMAEALVTIERNVKLQIQLIDDLLDVAKILRGKLSLNVTSVNLSSVIEAAIETVRTAAIAKSISVYPVLPNVGLVSGDAARLQQIIWNLLSNAIKFTPNGGQVNIRLEQLGNQAEITVSDTGKGIRPDFLPHIFESFLQEDASITRKYGGLGLGLAIIRQLVEAHGGTIAADSPGEGLGATFTVRLPLLIVEPQIKQTDELPQQELDLTGIRVLTVDDDPDARELLTVLLTQYGAEVLTVASAAEVLANLESFQPDVLVSDIGMPDVDGYSLIQQIRTLPPEKGGQISAIALTAYARVDDYQRALNSGYQRHITKPLEPEQLVQAVAALVRG